MRRIILLLLFRLLVAAQENDVSIAETQEPPTGALKTRFFSMGSNNSSFQRAMGTLPQSRLVPDVQKQQKNKPTQPSKPGGEPKPSIPGSMVGYIDNAIVESQFRIRADAAFHNDAPDRSEFFYAQYAGLSQNAPGPNSVVSNLNFQEFHLQVEWALTKRFSILTEVPVRWIQPQSTVANVNPNLPPPFPNVHVAGLSDVTAGFKLAAVASSNQYLTFQFKAYLPSGDASEGLGTSHYSVEPALLYFRRLSDRVTLETEMGDSHPIGGSFCPQPCVADLPSPPAAPPVSGGFAGDVFFYGVGPSYILYQGEHIGIAPVIELVGWRLLGGLQTICIPDMGNRCYDQEGGNVDGTNIVNLKMGVRTSIWKHNSFYLGFGQAVTHSVWYEHIVRAEYRYSF